LILVGPQAVNASTTYGVDHSAENNFGLGARNRTGAQKLNDARAAAATKPTFPIWILAGVVLAVLVYL
jgi:hypothetical protein